MKSLMVLVLLLAALCFLTNCDYGRHQQSENRGEPDCRSKQRDKITNGSGTVTLCVTATQCREDEMAKLISDRICQDPAQGALRDCNGPCNSGNCVGVTNSSGLVVTSVSWNRDKPCERPPGTNECTAPWEIPAGKSLDCGCDCK